MFNSRRDATANVVCITRRLDQAQVLVTCVGGILRYEMCVRGRLVHMGGNSSAHHGDDVHLTGDVLWPGLEGHGESA